MAKKIYLSNTIKYLQRPAVDSKLTHHDFHDRYYATKVQERTALPRTDRGDVQEILGPAEDGFLVVSPITGLTETWYAMVAFDLNDMRGVSKGNCQVQAPAKKMACNDCAVTGYWIKCYHTTLYPSAVSFLPARDPLRAQYRRTFSKCSVLRDLAKQDHPRFITGMHIVLLYDVISIIILHVVYLYITCSIFILL